MRKKIKTILKSCKAKIALKKEPIKMLETPKPVTKHWEGYDPKLVEFFKSGL